MHRTMPQTTALSTCRTLQIGLYSPPSYSITNYNVMQALASFVLSLASGVRKFNPRAKYISNASCLPHRLSDIPKGRNPSNYVIVPTGRAVVRVALTHICLALNSEICSDLQAFFLMLAIIRRANETMV